MNIIFQIDGGLGKSIMATAIVKIIKKKYKNSKLIVVTAYPDVFLNNPNVFETYRSDQSNGLYLKYIKDQNSKVFVGDPYRHNDFITEKSHLLKTWSRLFGLNHTNESPEIYLTQPEIEYFTPFYKTDKPILAIQTNGGPAEQNYNYAWTRDIPETTVLDVIEEFKDIYTIVHIKRQNQKEYPDTLSALDGFRSIAILLMLSSKRLLMDSFTQHLAKAVNKKSTVCWVTTKPEIFGYKSHDNIIAEPFTKEPILHTAVYQPFNLSQDIATIPYYNLNEVFSSTKIIESIKKQ